MTAIPITVLTGFLGSGKTTLIREMLSRSLLNDTAFLVNELGEVSIDDALIEVQSSDLSVLSGGCVCCEMGSGLLETLARLKERLASLPGLTCKRVVLETTGLADPVPMLQSMLIQECASLGFRLDGVVTTVDSVCGQSNIARFNEARRQVCLADRIIVTKRDLVSESVARDLFDLLRELSGAGSIEEMSPMRPPVSNLLDVGGLDVRSRTVEASLWLGGGLQRKVLSRIGHTPGIEVECIEIANQIRFADFVSWLSDLQEEIGDRLLRVKGILDVEEYEEPIAVHGVQGVFYPPIKLGPQVPLIGLSKLVFITEGLEKTFFARSMQQWGLLEASR